MTYLEHISSYFVSLVGKGASLSSQDVALVNRWEVSGLPAGHVCRGLRRAVDARARTVRVSISDCASSVERQLSRVQVADAANTAVPAEPKSGAASDVPSPRTLLTALVSVGQNCPDERVKVVYRALYRRVQTLPERPLTVSELNRLDESTTSDMLAQLPSGTRARLRQRLRQQALRSLGPDASQSAQRRLTASLVKAWLSEAHGLVLPSSLVG